MYDIVNEMFNSYCYFDSSTTHFSESSRKGYSLIDHAYVLVENNDELYLSDVISNLRKAINYRITALFSQLGINHLNFDGLGKDRKLEKLEELGIIKPLLINKLLSIRNGIEYNNAPPPNQIECEELIDIVWYFYKSTDRYCNIEPDAFVIENEKTKDFLRLYFDFKTHESLRIDGRLPLECFSETKMLNSVFIYDYITKNDSTQPAFFSGSLKVNEIKDYMDIFAISLCEWGNY